MSLIPGKYKLSGSENLPPRKCLIFLLFNCYISQNGKDSIPVSCVEKKGTLFLDN